MNKEELGMKPLHALKLLDPGALDLPVYYDEDEPIIPSCDACTHYHTDHKEPEGDCRANTPVFASGFAYAVWPKVYDEWHCSKFKIRTYRDEFNNLYRSWESTTDKDALNDLEIKTHELFDAARESDGEL